MSWHTSLWEALPSCLAQAAEPEATNGTIRELLDPASIPNLAIILGCSIGVIGVLGYYVADVIKTRSLNQLKRQMLEQGLSPEEIERVLRAGSSGAPRDGSAR